MDNIILIVFVLLTIDFIGGTIISYESNSNKDLLMLRMLTMVYYLSVFCPVLVFKYLKFNNEILTLITTLILFVLFLFYNIKQYALAIKINIIEKYLTALYMIFFILIPGHEELSKIFNISDNTVISIIGICLICIFLIIIFIYIKILVEKRHAKFFIKRKKNIHGR
jgi:hypothetical protein